jgi:hypothetical protein
MKGASTPSVIPAYIQFSIGGNNQDNRVKVKGTQNVQN